MLDDVARALVLGEDPAEREFERVGGERAVGDAAPDAHREVGDGGERLPELMGHDVRHLGDGRHALEGLELALGGLLALDRLHEFGAAATHEPLGRDRMPDHADEDRRGEDHPGGVLAHLLEKRLLLIAHVDGIAHALGRQMHGAIVRRTHPVDVGSDVKREERCGKFEQPHARDRKTRREHASRHRGHGTHEPRLVVDAHVDLDEAAKEVGTRLAQQVGRDREELVAALDRPSDDLGGRPAIGGDTHLDGR